MSPIQRGRGSLCNSNSKLAHDWTNRNRPLRGLPLYHDGYVSPNFPSPLFLSPTYPNTQRISTCKPTPTPSLLPQKSPTNPPPLHEHRLQSHRPAYHSHQHNRPRVHRLQPRALRQPLAARRIPAPRPPLRAVPLPAARRLRRHGFPGRCRVGQARVLFAELRERGGARMPVAANFLCCGGRSESGGEWEWEWGCERDGERGDCEE